MVRGGVCVRESASLLRSLAETSSAGGRSNCLESRLRGFSTTGDWQGKKEYFSHHLKFLEIRTRGECSRNLAAAYLSDSSTERRDTHPYQPTYLSHHTCTPFPVVALLSQAHAILRRRPQTTDDGCNLLWHTKEKSQTQSAPVTQASGLGRCGRIYVRMSIEEERRDEQSRHGSAGQSSPHCSLRRWMNKKEEECIVFMRTEHTQLRRRLWHRDRLRLSFSGRQIKEIGNSGLGSVIDTSKC